MGGTDMRSDGSGVWLSELLARIFSITEAEIEAEEPKECYNPDREVSLGVADDFLRRLYILQSWVMTEYAICPSECFLNESPREVRQAVQRNSFVMQSVVCVVQALLLRTLVQAFPQVTNVALLGELVPRRGWILVYRKPEVLHGRGRQRRSCSED